ncbi:MAG TPA: hypothetical protein VGL38_08300 [bacterium]
MAPYLLLLLMFFQAISGFAGGVTLLASPDGRLIQFPADALDKSPFPDYLIPGLALLLLLGVYPALVCYGLLRRPHWRWAEALNVHKENHWSLTHALYVGIMLIFWIDVEMIWISYSPLQTVYGLLGLAMVITALTPGARRFYRKVS